MNRQLVALGPCMFIVLPHEGKPWCGATVSPEEMPSMIDWLSSRVDADPAVRDLVAAALSFVNWATLDDEEDD